MKTNLIPFNKVALLCAAVCAAATLAFTQNASAVVINPDDQLVGTVTPGVPSNPGDEADYINVLISLAANTSNHFDPGTGQTYDRTAFVTTGLPAADANTANKVDDPTNLTLTLDGTFTYILAKYDAGRAGSMVWYVGGLVGEFTIPGTFNGHDISHYTTFGGGGVPDGGTTVMLLGAALGALGVVRRYLIS
jgi:VPDSG-CTERM motif